MLGGRAAAPPSKLAKTDLAAPIPKAQKGTIRDLFSQVPEDSTIEQSKWETYYQQSTSTNPLTIMVSRTREWVDMRKTILEFDVQFKKNDGTLLDNNSKAFPINNIGHSLIKQIKVSINKGSIQPNDDKYHYQAYLDQLLNFSKADKEGWMSMEGWSTDTPGKFDDTNPLPRTITDATNSGTANTYTQAALNTWLGNALARVTPNEGAVFRHKLCADGKTVKFFISPCIHMFRSYRYLPPGCEVTFETMWNPCNLVMMAAQADNAAATAPTFTIVPNT
ncbi:uncharacterized protein F54H12.2-like [Actinia tenebrosa]|uniref:Uncharacterized protein F54H12.2-like n=1 Tax=Actinia tenebrosa TaxID=6105 RepID=A0A6P8H8W3_ACTTE|nr:uncharacterized protein F54H12.2-like [Actinia tenebrosa]